MVPPDRYDIVINRLLIHPPSKAYWSDPVTAFLSRKCSPEFLKLYYGKAGSIGDLASAIVSIWLNSDSLKIMNKLQKAGLLDEAVRLNAAQRILMVSERDHSCHFIESIAVKNLLTKTEAEEAIEKVVNKLLGDGESIIEDLCSGWDKESDPDDCFYEVKRTLNFIDEDERFSDDQKWEAGELLAYVMGKVKNMEEKKTETTYETLDTEKATEVEVVSVRSIFDDVDE